MAEPSLTEVLGRLVAETSAEMIPAAVLRRAAGSLAHNLAVARAGRPRETVAHVMARRFWADPAEASLLWDGTRVSVEGAAFANAALINALSQDDTHAPSTSHPGSPTMAAALAVGEAGGSSGEDFLVAIVLGYEVLGRIGRDFDEGITERGFRAAAVLAPFGAAAAAARLMRLSAQQTAHALGLAANLSSGLSQVWREGSAEGPLQLGFAARNGIAAARAAALGATAAAAVLEGPAGFFRAFAGTGQPPREALDGIGRHWQFDEVTVKPFPVCAILQGPVRLFLDLVGKHAITPALLADILVVLSPYEAAYPGIDNAGPFASSIATKMSAQFSLGLAAVDGAVTVDGLARVSDEAVLAVAGRVRIAADAAIIPRHSRVMIQLADGRSLAGSVNEPVGKAEAAAALVPDVRALIGAFLRGF